MRKIYYTVACLTILIMAGCSHYGQINADYGNSYTKAKTGQILNPSASKNQAPVTGLNGKAADAITKKYTESFATSGQASQGPQSFAITPIVPSEGAGMGQNVYGK